MGDSNTTRAAVLGRLSSGRIPGATTVSTPGADCYCQYFKNLFMRAMYSDL